MIICSCNIISDCKVKSCLHLIDKPTVSAIFRELDAQPQCASCIQTMVRLLQEHKESQESK